jgi:hypothetical protein
LLRLILDSHENLSCGPETRFLADMAKITGQNWRRLAHYGFPKEYWHDKIAAFFDSIMSDYAARRGKSRWADKTPLYALSLDFITELFPECQVIHVIRDGRDVVASHRERWGYWSAVKAVEKWPRYIRAAREVGAQLSPDRYIEVRYEELVRDTEKTMRGLLDFLGEPWDPTVLEHDKVEHDVADKYAPFASSRRKGDGEQAVYRSRVGAGKRIDPMLRLLFAVRSGRFRKELGYS